MMRKIWTAAGALATILVSIAVTAGPASAGMAINHSEPLARR